MTLPNEDNWSQNLDNALKEVKASISDGLTFSKKIPRSVRNNIDKWKFGHYGWTSPVNLILTAAWYKWFNPHQDVCIIWAKSGNEKIPGGFSLRSIDEKYTVKFISKHDIYKNFCSANSGMQGSRALEKNNLRARKERINRDSDLGQTVKFEIKLFQNILNDINDQDSSGAENYFKYLLEKSLYIQKKRQNNELAIEKEFADLDGFHKKPFLEATQLIKDPQFIKCIGSLYLWVLVSHTIKFSRGILKGVKDPKTGADARSRTPGDIWIEVDDKPILACEVKDKTKTFSFEILSAINDRIKINQNVKNYICLTSADIAVDRHTIRDLIWEKRIEEIRDKGCKVQFFTISEILEQIDILIPEKGQIYSVFTNLLIKTSDLKIDTLDSWNKILSKHVIQK